MRELKETAIKIRGIKKPLTVPYFQSVRGVIIRIQIIARRR